MTWICFLYKENIKFSSLVEKVIILGKGGKIFPFLKKSGLSSFQKAVLNTLMSEFKAGVSG